MSDDKDPATGERAQLEQFLTWRRANFGRRAARRRRWFRYVAVMSSAVICVALVTWVTESARDARGRVTFERRHAPPESVAAASHDSAPPARLSAPPTGPVIERTPAEEGPRVTARGTRSEPFKHSSGTSQARPLPPREPSSFLSPVAEAPSQTSDVAGGVPMPAASLGLNEAVSSSRTRTPTAPPANVPPSPLPKETVTERSGSIATATPANPKPDDAQTVASPASKPEAVIEPASPPNGSDTVASAGSGGASTTEAGQSQAGHRQPKGRVVAESVVSWLEGEVREFHDGAKREIGEFRAGFEKVRRLLLTLPSCLAITEDRDSCRPAPRRP